MTVTEAALVVRAHFDLIDNAAKGDARDGIIKRGDTLFSRLTQDRSLDSTEAKRLQKAVEIVDARFGDFSDGRGRITRFTLDAFIASGGNRRAPAVPVDDTFAED